jgi:hypothetical protein
MTDFPPSLSHAPKAVPHLPTPLSVGRTLAVKPGQLIAMPPAVMPLEWSASIHVQIGELL